MPVSSDVNGGVNMQGEDHSVSMLVRMTTILLSLAILTIIRLRWVITNVLIPVINQFHFQNNLSSGGMTS